ncbi:hypothetical protein MKEN_00766200 [Mycena kentingensis (nom. inval.)]|nr:hypothetical protein MKEN_00766200 [Mycena kentingensis (nom. inval.)]
MRARCLVPLSLLLPALATVVVIDDQNGDPTNGRKIQYSGAPWASGNIAGCSEPCVLPDPSFAHQGTFTGSISGGHDLKGQPRPQTSNATVTFDGTSLSVQCILSNSLTRPRGRTRLQFYVDGVQSPSSFGREPTGTGDYHSATVFTVRNLTLGPHILVIQNVGSEGEQSLVILDSVSYSDDEDLTLLPGVSFGPTSSIGLTSMGAGLAAATASPSPPTSSATAKSHSAAPIVGAVVGVLAVLLLLLLAFLYIRQRRKQRKSNVPLCTTVFSPLVDLWSAARGSAKPAPDMAPVPFPTPTQPVFIPAAARAHARPRHSAPAAPTSSRLSRISFNPNLLVGRIRRQPPPPISTQPDPGSPVISSGNPLMRSLSAQPEHFASIHVWQQQTHEATINDPPVPPVDMSEELSSYYDQSSSSPPPPAHPPPAAVAPRSPQPQRRFTVMNN